jgi:subtilisin family serine protease
LKSPERQRLRRWLALATAAALCACPPGVTRTSARAGVSDDDSRASSYAGDAAKAGEHKAGGRDKISRDLRAIIGASDAGKSLNVVIVRRSDAPRVGVGLHELLRGLGGGVTRKLARLGILTASVPAGAVESLAARDDVLYITPDRPTAAAGHVETTTGTDQIRTQTVTSLLGLVTTTTDGSGVGIAVLDSGVDASHESFRNALGQSRVAYSQDFTGEGRTDDPYGHGTHVASLAAGSGQPSGGAYTGIAPGASIINLRVLDSQGQGTTSSLLAALDWVLQNKTLYNIRVVNLSLGTPAVEDYADDPACNAVRQLVDAGIVVVAAAGNNGKDSQGNKIYGQVHSPGDEPSAITVGAANTFGTDSRADDGVTTYSSRGPTRGFWTDDGGANHYDNLIKPDIIAPGNKLVGAASSNSLILSAHPELNVDASAPLSRRMMYLSGTSMATPVTAGAAALVLQANPSLTPNLVKAILMLTAQPLAGFNTLEQGAGELNVEGAVRLARLVRADLSPLTQLGEPLLAGGAPSPQSAIAGQMFQWSQGLVLDHTFVSGGDLWTLYQRVYASGAALGGGVVESGGAQSLNASQMTAGVALGQSVLTSDGSTLASGSPLLDVSALSAGTLPEGIMVGDGVLVGDGVMVGDGIMVGDTTLEAQSAMFGGD